MADITITNVKAQFDWQLQRGASTATRTFSIDDVTYDAAGVSKATAFRDIFTGAASSPFTQIDATKFWQPTGWRDNDDTEEEWTTTGCNLSIIQTNEWQVDSGSGGGGTGERNLEITGADDEMDPEVIFYYDGLSESNPPVVSVYYNGQWNTVAATYGQGTEQRAYFKIDKTSAMANANGTIYLPASGEYPAEVHEFTIVY